MDTKIKWSDPQLIKFQIESAEGFCHNGTGPGPGGGGDLDCENGLGAQDLLACDAGNVGPPPPPGVGSSISGWRRR